MILRFCVFALILLAGCSTDPDSSEIPVPVRAPVQMSSRIHQVGGNEVVVLDIPSHAVGSTRIEVQRCFVWRDAEYKTASITCPTEPDYVLDEHAEP